jgi:Zn-dependent M28 family amino/carboxypeptidase
MIGRSKPSGDKNPANKMLTGPDSIYVIGSRRLSTQLGATVSTVNKRLYNLNLDYHYDQPNDPENLYQRSDHFNYAKHGIPIAFFFDGVHVDYHQVSDEVGKIDFRKMERVARTVCAIAWTLANNAQRPAVDKK